MDFLVNYVSIWDKEWFIGLMKLFFDILTVGGLSLLILSVVLISMAKFILFWFY